ncbi:MAG: hypothetical protein PWP31_652 [Clostridia bacterium]|nr:hypothetical protein [Clostridia bacterium]
MPGRGVVNSKIVYLDIIFLINLALDYLILWTTAKLGQLYTSFWRLFFGSAVGALYSLSILSPSKHFMLLMAVKIIFSVLMVFISFYPLNVRRFLQVLAYFYLTAFVMGGAMLGAIFLGGGEFEIPVMGTALTFVSNISYKWLLAAIIAALVMAYWGTAWIKKNFWQHILRLPIVINFAGQRRVVKALVDTGNSLRDPLSQKPVIIVEYSALKEILPSEIIKEYTNDEPDLNSLVNSLTTTPWASRLHLIPYQSLGQSQGLLLGLRPDEVVVVTNERMIKVNEVIVGLYKKRLSPEGNYRALLHPDLLDLSMGL